MPLTVYLGTIRTSPHGVEADSVLLISMALELIP